MSVISQFFPSGGGGGGGGNESPTGIKIPQDGIPVQILGVSGAGGPGGSGGSDGMGGRGALFHTTNYHVQPGCTVPITIGAGGAVGPQCPCGQGGGGGTTSFNYDILPISVEGGGGGSKGSPCGCNQYGACPGGTGGGAKFNPGCPGNQQICAGEGKYYQKITEVESNSLFCWCNGCSWASTQTFKTSDAQMLKYSWGVKGGFPGLPADKTPSPLGYNICCEGDSGHNAGNTFRYFCMTNPGNMGCPIDRYRCAVCVCTGVAYRSEITGDINEYGPGCDNTFGYQGGPTAAGCAGGLVIQWATAFGAAPPTGFPGATDISPSTPGYYTYCFTSSGSIVLP